MSDELQEPVSRVAEEFVRAPGMQSLNDFDDMRHLVFILRRSSMDYPPCEKSHDITFVSCLHGAAGGLPDQEPSSAGF